MLKSLAKASAKCLSSRLHQHERYLEASEHLDILEHSSSSPSGTWTLYILPVIHRQSKKRKTDLYHVAFLHPEHVELDSDKFF